jgi:hypothetical protein
MSNLMRAFDAMKIDHVYTPPPSPPGTAKELYSAVNMTEIDLEQVEDILTVMLRTEFKYRRSDYLSQKSMDHILDCSWRQRIVEWMFGVVDHCSLRRDSVATASYYLDLCVERGLISSRQEYQLAAMTALLIAIKMIDSTVVKLQSMVVLGRGLFSENDVIVMEKQMLRCLDWNVHPPTSLCFLHQFLRLLPQSVAPAIRYMIVEVTRFIAEISMCLYRFVEFPSSVIAYAGMLIAMERIDLHTLPQWQRHEVFGIMLRFAKMDCRSAVVQDAMYHLHLALEKNVSLDELMSTIGAQCPDGYNLLRPAEYPKGRGSCTNSPRDVTNKT